MRYSMPPGVRSAFRALRWFPSADFLRLQPAEFLSIRPRFPARDPPPSRRRL
jgi:hypothetical protein